MRGHGGTEGDRGHCGGIAEAVRDLHAIQDHLAYRMPDAPKVIVGQGLGALWALAHALEMPGTLAALGLLSPLHEPRFEIPAEVSGVKRLFKKRGPKTAGTTGYRANQLTTDGEQALAWQNDPLTHDCITVRAAEQAQQAARTYLPRLAEVGLPVLVLHGTDDPISSSERSVALAGEGIEVRLFPGMRHQLLHDSQAAEVRGALVDWLGRLPAS
jgi:alpha-beta hydrolase superfamily lysophospholipase